MPKAKAKKGKSKAAAKREAAIRERLEKERGEILDMYQHDLKVGQQTGDEASEDIVDRANNAYQREFMFNLSATERKIVREIEGALQRLDAGSYGVCAHCGEEVAEARLQAVPWARYCIACQEKQEQGVLDS